MAEPGIKIEGIPELKKIMDEVGSLRPVKRGLAVGAVQLRSHVRQYPKQIPSVNPKWRYDRGVGSVYLPTGRVYRTSEDHANSWAGKSRHGGLTWIIGSDTTYGPFLQDERKQTLRHKRANWQTVEDVIDDNGDDVVRAVKRAIDIELAKGHA